MAKLTQLVLLTCPIILLIQQVHCGGMLKIKLEKFENPSNKIFSLECCDVPCSAGCNNIFRICLQDMESPEPDCAPTANVTVITDRMMPEIYYKLASFDMKLYIKLIAYDLDPGRVDVIDHASGEIDPLANDTIVLNGTRQMYPTSFEISVTRRCDKYYYGPMCDKMCRPRDNFEGHYTCNNETGEKVCNQGWSGAECDQPMGSCGPPTPSVTPGLCQAVDMIFVLDSSRSVNNIDPENWQRAKTFVKACVDRVTLGPVSYQMGVVTFSSMADLSIKLSDSSDATAFKDKVDALPYMGEKTNLRAGLSVTRTKGFNPEYGGRPFAHKAVVLVYDGEKPTPEFGTLGSEAGKLNAMGVDVTVVSLDYYFSKGQSTKDLVEKIASEPRLTHLFTELSDWSTLPKTVAPSILANFQDSCMRKNRAPPGGPPADATTVGAAPTTQATATGPFLPSALPDAKCMIRGYCSAASEDQKCYCMPGFAGKNCELMADPCASDPCMGGNCTRMGGMDYMCTTCPPGLDGMKCENKVGGPVTCADDPCKTGGGTAPNCPQTPIAPEGTCPDPTKVPCAQFYYGTNCDVLCVPLNNCMGHYDCSPTGQKVCLEGWSGEDTNCTTKAGGSTEQCTPACGNGGVCFNEGCCCPPGSEGPDCLGGNFTDFTMSGTGGTGTTPGMTGSTAVMSSGMDSSPSDGLSTGTTTLATSGLSSQTSEAMTPPSRSPTTFIPVNPAATTTMGSNLSPPSPVTPSGATQPSTTTGSVSSAGMSSAGPSSAASSSQTQSSPGVTSATQSSSAASTSDQSSSTSLSPSSTAATTSGAPTQAEILDLLGQYVAQNFPNLSVADKIQLLNELFNEYLNTGNLPDGVGSAAQAASLSDSKKPIFRSEESWAGEGQLSGYYILLEINDVHFYKSENKSLEIVMAYHYIVTDKYGNHVGTLSPAHYHLLSQPGTENIHDYIVTTLKPAEINKNDNEEIIKIAVGTIVGGVILLILLSIITWRLIARCKKNRRSRDKEEICDSERSSYIGHGPYSTLSSYSDPSKGSISSKMQYVEA